MGGFFCTSAGGARVDQRGACGRVRRATARRAVLEGEKRLLITMGGAAGVAVAFNAPIGGVLYMFEEIASFWAHRTTMWAFLCTTVGAAAMKALKVS